MGAKDYVVSCSVEPDLYEKWKKFIKDNGFQYTGALSSMRQIHSDLISNAIDSLMSSSTEDIEKFFKEYRR